VEELGGAAGTVGPTVVGVLDGGPAVRVGGAGAPGSVVGPAVGAKAAGDCVMTLIGTWPAAFDAGRVGGGPDFVRPTTAAPTATTAATVRRPTGVVKIRTRRAAV